ncbi:PAS domain S-box protein [Sporomusa aerivorans]|uniref:PAS domain S-box protein n=1 Tax=Sporomusa aerivorans TaxID=204936 RepID=UPI00352A660C
MGEIKALPGNIESSPYQRRSYMQAAQSLIRSLSISGSPATFLDNVVTLIQQETGVECIGIRVLDEHGYIPYQSYVGFSREFWETENMILISCEDCSCTRIITGNLLACDKLSVNSSGSLCVNDTADFVQQLSVAEFGLYRGTCVKTGFRSIAIIPIVYSGSVVGIIHLADFQPNMLSLATMEFVEFIAPLVGEVLARAHVENSVKTIQDTKALLENIVAGISSLAYIVDLRTYELIYVNKSLARPNCLDPANTQKCYELFGFTSVCPNCPVAKNLTGSNNSESRERYDSTGDRYYLAERKTLNLPQSTLSAAFVSDITQQKNAAKALRDTNIELEKSVVELQQLSATLEEEITERQAVQEALEKYRLFFLHSRDIMLFVNRNSGRILEANPAASKAYGYTREELLDSYIFDLRQEQDILLVKSQMKIATESGITFEAIHRRKNGSLFPVEVSSSVKSVGNEKVVFSVIRDISELRKMQAEIHEQVKLAGAVQKSLLPPYYQDDQLTIHPIFRPLTVVSGDFFGYRLTHDKTKLHGYLIDVSGHGIATALYTSAISSLLNEAIDREDPWSRETFNWLNQYIFDHMSDNVLVALITFTIDFTVRQITCWSGGINYLLASTQCSNGIVAIPGIYLGATRTPKFDSLTLPLQNGDTFYFMSDGISERLPREIVNHAAHFDETLDQLRRFTNGTVSDDCSALCIELRGLKQFPLYFDYSDLSQRLIIRHRINQLLINLTGEKAAKISIPFGEAIVNATQHGSSVHIKINKIGAKLILRVQDNGAGFRGNARVAELASADIGGRFEALLTSERGRGIPLMVLWSDKVLYNKQGNEVMLVKYLTCS